MQDEESKALDIRSVSEVTKYIKGLMDRDQILSRIMIRGEISNFKQYSSGHCYFTLKDAASSLKAVMFRSRVQHLKFMPVNGMQVVVTGSITVYERDGAYQLYADSLLPEGAGELSLAFDQLKERLTQEGLFLPEHKQALPAFPKTIGIVTSPSGAVLRDIYRVAKRRNPNVQLVLYPVQVQGEQSAGQIVEALDFFNRQFPVDVLIVGRGGGSMEDLWSFNEEVVVRAIFASRLPVISAVGHETDFTLADFVSDMRAATPSQAAELAVPDAGELVRYIESLRAQLVARGRQQLQLKQARLAACQQSTALRTPQMLLAQRRQRFDLVYEKFRQLVMQTMKDKKHALQVPLEKLAMLNPVNVLARGYGIVQAGETVLRGVANIKAGDAVEVIMTDGRFSATVGEVREGNVYGKNKETFI